MWTSISAKPLWWKPENDYWDIIAIRTDHEGQKMLRNRSAAYKIRYAGLRSRSVPPRRLSVPFPPLMLWPPVQRHPHQNLVSSQPMMIARNVQLPQGICLQKPEYWSLCFAGSVLVQPWCNRSCQTPSNCFLAGQIEQCS